MNKEKDSHSSDSRIGLVLLALGALVVLFAAFFGRPHLVVNDILKAREATDWPTVEGTMLASKIVLIQEGSHAGRRANRYAPEVSYTYQVGDTEYRGDRFRFTPTYQFGAQGREKLREILQGYEFDSQVEVYYDPDQPQVSVLSPGFTDFAAVRAATNLALWFCLALALMGAGAWFRKAS